MVKAEASNEAEVLAAPSQAGTIKDTIDEAAALFHEHVKLGQVAKVEGPHVEIYAHRKSVELPPPSWP